MNFQKLQQKASEAGVYEPFNNFDPGVYCEECGLEFDTDWKYTRDIGNRNKRPYKINLCSGCGHLQFVELGGGVDDAE